MKFSQLTRLVTLTLLLVLVFASQVTAWGILPARQLADFTQSTQQLSIDVKNTDFSEGYFAVEFAGDLAEYASYTGGTVYVSADQSSYTIPFTLTLPESVEPGKRTLKVVLRELTSDTSTVTINSLLTLVGEVVVNAPQQGNYVTAQLSIDGATQTQDVPITISLLNKGDSSVVVYADVVILGPTNQPLASWSTDTMILDYLGSSKIETYWTGEKNSGLYFTEVTLHYGEKTQVLRKEFLVGSKQVVSETIGADRFTLGDIVPMTITAANKWNDVMKGVFAEIYVLTKDGQLVQTFKSTPEDISANSKKDLVAYWDTANLLVGNYDLNVLLNYPGGQTQKQYPVLVTLDSLQVSNQLTGQVIESPESGGNNTSLMIILLIVLIVTNVIIILYFKRMKKGGGSKT